MRTTPAPVVVGIDGSPAALGAVRHAAARAARDGAPLRLVHAYEFPLGAPTGVTVQESMLRTLRQQGQEWLAAAREAAIEVDADLEIDVELAAMPTTAALSHAAADAALLVLGNRGRSPVTGLLVGSTALALAGRAPCPVVLVPVSSGDQSAFPVVVGVDGTAASEAAVAFAFAEAAALRAPLVAVHAWAESLFETALIANNAPLDWDRHREQAEATLAERLAGWQEKYPDVRVEREVIHDRPNQALRGYAQAARLMVVGRHARHGLRELVLGSTSQHVLHHASCPVAVVRPETLES